MQCQPTASRATLTHCCLCNVNPLQCQPTTGRAMLTHCAGGYNVNLHCTIQITSRDLTRELVVQQSDYCTDANCTSATIHSFARASDPVLHLLYIVENSQSRAVALCGSSGASPAGAAAVRTAGQTNKRVLRPL